MSNSMDDEPHASVYSCSYTRTDLIKEANIHDMSRNVSSCRSRVLAEAAGIKLVMTAPEISPDILIIVPQPGRTSLTLKIEKEDDDDKRIKGSWGFHLSRSKWDPYPWIGYVETGSIAYKAGLRAGDCLLNIEGTDLVGLRVKDIASLIRKDAGRSVRLEVWRSFRPAVEESDEGLALAGPLPEVARKLANAISGTVRALECPVCLESAASPVSQCVHGHILCVGCRARTPRCPVCRVRLGQGRCLLADEVQRNIREAFADNRDENSSSNDGASLRDKLFGSNGKKAQRANNESHHNSRLTTAKVKSSLARLLLGGFDKAASAENLTVATHLDEGITKIDGGRPAAYRRLGELCHSDRTKSASTGELSRGNENPADPSIYHLGSNRSYTSATGLLSVPQTPTWGGSTESINNSSSFQCPLSRWTSCKEYVTAGFVLEHLGRRHRGAQVHFNDRRATIPLPLPFGRDSSYIFHHRGELFFFQYENETAWIAGTGTENLGEWTIHGENDNGTRVELRRLVARLDDTTAPLSCHLAPLPKALDINNVIVELLDSRLGERLEV